jgi:hypothetical protein
MKLNSVEHHHAGHKNKEHLNLYHDTDTPKNIYTKQKLRNLLILPNVNRSVEEQVIDVYNYDQINELKTGNGNQRNLSNGVSRALGFEEPKRFRLNKENNNIYMHPQTPSHLQLYQPQYKVSNI